MIPIHFFSEDSDYKLSQPEKIMGWIQSVIIEYGYSLVEINYVFCSDEYLLKINKQFLQHDFYTDIITFNNADRENELEADIFISIDRVRENAVATSQSLNQELYRVMIHGVLHLLGFDDNSSEQKEEMRKKEDSCLSLLNLKSST